jgi:acyl-CoA thioesterase
LIFTLADSAFAYACNSENHNTVAAGARVDFLAPGRLGDRLTAVAERVSQGGRTGIYDVSVTNQQGKTVAMFRGNSHRIGGALVDQATGEPV